MKIVITQAHIDQANQLVHVERKHSDEFCPTCLSLRELFPEAHEISVGFITVTIDHKTFLLRNPAPDWIVRWSNRQSVEPTTFEMVEEL